MNIIKTIEQVSNDDMLKLAQHLRSDYIDKQEATYAITLQRGAIRFTGSMSLSLGPVSYKVTARDGYLRAVPKPVHLDAEGRRAVVRFVAKVFELAGGIDNPPLSLTGYKNNLHN